VVIDCSTAIPSSTRALAGRVAARGSKMMDAAMTRTPLEAEQGRLNLLIGADADLLEEMRPLLECFSENRTHAGDVGAGHALKLLHNFVSVGCATLIGEAFACAPSAGVSGAVLVEALRSGGGQGIALERIAPFVLEGDTSRLRFTVANARKDLEYYMRLAGDAGAAQSVAGGVLDALTALTDAGMDGRYLSETPDAFGSLPPG
jgi:3-hydroxyisobutyrate dehydrogenase-like beta-hydroxyacid dehydrogenase